MIRMKSPQKTVCSVSMPIPVLTGSGACTGSPERNQNATRTEAGRVAAVPLPHAGSGAWRPLPRLAFGPVSRPPLALHSRGSYGYIASRGGRGAPPHSGGDLTSGEAMTRGGVRSAVPLTGGRIPGCAGAPALRLERVRHSRAASGHTSPAPVSRILVRNPG
jgi:hypothetical protein